MMLLGCQSAAGYVQVLHLTAGYAVKINNARTLLRALSLLRSCTHDAHKQVNRPAACFQINLNRIIVLTMKLMMTGLTALQDI